MADLRRSQVAAPGSPQARAKARPARARGRLLSAAASLSLFLSIPTGLWAQAAPAPSSFEAQTELVQVDVIVRRDGKPLKGLKQKDFTLYDNDAPQKISFFAIRTARDTPEPKPLPSGVVTNWPQRAGEEPVSATIILIDRLNTAFLDQNYVRYQLTKFLETTTRNEPIALYAMGNELHRMVPFTTQHQQLLEAVDRMSSQNSRNLNAGDDVQAVEDAYNCSSTPGPCSKATAAIANIQGNAMKNRAGGTSGAFAMLASILKGLPGRKKLVWISAAMPVLNQQPELSVNQNFARQLYGPAQLLNDANVALYSIDPRGGAAPLADPGISYMQQIARMTGGRAIVYNNNIAGGIEQVLADTDVTYTLGFYPSLNKEDRETGDKDEAGDKEKDKKDSGADLYHSLRVEVDARDTEVRYRMGYSVDPPPVIRDADQRSALLLGFLADAFDATELRVTAQVHRIYNRPGLQAVEATVDMNQIDMQFNGERWLGSVDFGVAPANGNLSEAHIETLDLNLTDENYQRLLRNEVVLKAPVVVADLTGRRFSSQLRVVVMDGRTGEAGSVLLPVLDEPIPEPPEAAAVSEPPATQIEPAQPSTSVTSAAESKGVPK